MVKCQYIPSFVWSFVKVQCRCDVHQKDKIYAMYLETKKICTFCMLCWVSFRGDGGAFAPLIFICPPLGSLILIPIDKGCVNYNCNTMHKTLHKYNYMSHNNPSILSIPYVYDIFQIIVRVSRAFP